MAASASPTAARPKLGGATQGTTVSKTITVTNLGNATLTLTSLNAATMPSGFTLVSNLGSTSLAAGQSTTFTVRLDATQLVQRHNPTCQ